MDKNRSLDILESCIKMLKDMSDEEFSQSLKEKKLVELENNYYIGNSFNILESSLTEAIIVSTHVTNFNFSFDMNKPDFYSLSEVKGEQVYVDAA